MSRWLKLFFFLLIVKPLVLIVIGLNVRDKTRLPTKGPAIVVANHNSHLDALVLLSLFPLHQIHKIRPVAAGDYFMRNPFYAWLSTRLIGIIPIKRQQSKGLHNPFKLVNQALSQGDIIVIFPEGSRGEPEKMNRMKKGVAHLAIKHPEVPIIPIFVYGLGKALPRGEGLLVPFICDLYIGKAMYASGNVSQFMTNIQDSFAQLSEQARVDEW